MTVIALINVLIIGVVGVMLTINKREIPNEVLAHYHIQPCAKQQDPIPRIIHQIWTTNDIPQKWRTLQQGCIKMNPDYEYMLWTHSAIDKFIEKNYPWILDTYNNYPYPMEKLDAARYFILYHYGGIYLDMDMECKVPFDRILQNVSSEAEVVLGATAPVGVTSSFLMAKKNHRLLKQMTEGLPQSNRWYISPYWTVIMSTGPLYVWRSYLNYPCNEQIHVLPYELHSRQYLDHKHASTWHSWDGPIMLFFDHHGKTLLIIAALAVCALVILTIFRKCSPRNSSALPYQRRILPTLGFSHQKHAKKFSDEAAECVKFINHGEL